MEENAPEANAIDIQIPVVVSFIMKANEKVDVATGNTKHDVNYDKGTLNSFDSRPCHCFITGDQFSTVEFNKVSQKGIRIVPGIRIPISEKKEMGQPYVWTNHADIIDFRILDKRWNKRFVLNTKLSYIIIRPFSMASIDQSRHNVDLIKAVQSVYESMGMHSKDGPGYLSDYDTVFADYFYAKYKELYKAGKVKFTPKFRIPFCTKHKIAGQYYSQNGQYYCNKCKAYIG